MCSSGHHAYGKDGRAEEGLIEVYNIFSGVDGADTRPYCRGGPIVEVAITRGCAMGDLEEI